MEKATYHLQPAENWMNDPNGMSFISGRFHMFYQHNPSAPVWGNMTWGHAVSPDMVRWERLPHALHPDMPYDKDGVFSGCCVVKEGVPHIIYTGVYPETVCLATGSIDGMCFTKCEDNPILTNGGRMLNGWRDPDVWEERGGYRMLMGSGDNGGAFTEAYTGADLLHWMPTGRIAEAREHGLADTMWECPAMMINPSGEAVLFVSALPSFTVRSLIGTYSGGTFTAAAVVSTDYGDSLYAPSLVRHPDGRWIMFGWLRECGNADARAQQGWQGMLTLPRALTLENGVLYVRPAAEVDTLRGRRIAHINNDVRAADIQTGQHFEIDARVRLGGGSVRFELLSGGHGACVCVEFDGTTIRVERGALAEEAAPTLTADVVPYEHNHIRIFVDGTSIEIFINSRKTLSTRAYPHSRCTGLGIIAYGACLLEAMDVYAMENCYTTR